MVRPIEQKLLLTVYTGSRISANLLVSLQSSVFTEARSQDRRRSRRQGAFYSRQPTREPGHT